MQEANSKRQTAQSEEREAAQGALDTNLLSSSETGTPCENPGLTRAKTRVAAAAHQDPLGVSRRLLILSLIPAKNCFFSSLFFFFRSFFCPLSGGNIVKMFEAIKICMCMDGNYLVIKYGPTLRVRVFVGRDSLIQ